jgi:peptidoglycan/LPS O-acetylase OafA/YrhL
MQAVFSSLVASTDQKPRGFRPEVQGLRAVAVGLVVLYHFWPLRLTGGFVGVDVFFVISGFLITSHLMKEVVRDGSVSLRTFWARRIRRLLPASLLVLAVSAVATVLWVYPTQWATTARQLIASALYVQNWALASDSVDYLAQGDAPTLAQHFWSLSVEEQFYIVWPLLLVGGLALGRRFGRGSQPVRTAAIVIAVVGLTSFVISVAGTAYDPAWAYFATPTRIWELALGAGLALTQVRLHVGVRVVMGWLGIAAVVASAFVLDGGTPFPGWVAAVPTLGTVAVIAAGQTRSRIGVDRMLSLRPSTFLGDISYSVYLWHWPLVVVAPMMVGRTLGWVDKLVLIVLVVLMSWATKVHVEDRFRAPRRAGTGVARTYALAAAGMAVVVVLGVGIRVELAARAEAGAAEVANLPTDCLGPAALADPATCGGPMGTDSLLAPPEVVSQQNKEIVYPDCQAPLASTSVVTCRLGSTDPGAPLVMLVGDSHGSHWFPTLDRLGNEHGFRVEAHTKSSCPPTAAERVLEVEQNRTNAESCRAWLAAVNDRVLTNDPSLVIVAAYSSAYDYAPPSDQLVPEGVIDPDDPAVSGYAELWHSWQETGIPVAAIAAVPRTQGENVPDCLAAHPDDFAVCAVARAEALPPDPMVAAAELTNARLVDLSDQFCDDSTCYPVVGSIIVYRDYSHLSAEYAEALTPYVESALEGLLPTG